MAGNDGEEEQPTPPARSSTATGPQDDDGGVDIDGAPGTAAVPSVPGTAAAPAPAATPAPSAAPDAAALDAIVASLSQNPELIALVERGVASLAVDAAASGASNPGVGAAAAPNASATSGSTDEVTRRVVRNVLLERLAAGAGTGAGSANVGGGPAAGTSRPQQQQQQQLHQSASGASLSGAGAPPVKTVTFSTISVPDVEDDGDDVGIGQGQGQDRNQNELADGGLSAAAAAAAATRRDSNEEYGYDGEADGEGSTDFEAMRRTRGRSASPPPPPFPSLLQDEYHYARGHTATGGGGNSRGRSRSPTAQSLGMSSVTSAEVGDMSLSRPAGAGAGVGAGGAAAAAPTAGEATASGDESSVASAFSRGSRSSRGSRNAAGGNASVTFASDTAFVAATGGGVGTTNASTSSSAGGAHVHFSAINPSPSLQLQNATGGEGEEDNALDSSGPRAVSFLTDGLDGDEARARTNVLAERVGRAARSRSRSRSRSPPPPIFDRGVSWEDENDGATTPPNATRSGLSSPAIEPSLSPLSASSRSRRSGSIQFNETTELITEAADRLRRQDRRGEENATNGGARTAETNDPEGPHSPPGSDAPGTPSDEQRPTYHRTPSGRVVHFSALRDVAVVETDHAAAGSVHSGGIVASEQIAAATNAASDDNHTGSTSAVHFADDIDATDNNALIHEHHLPAEGLGILPGHTTTSSFHSESELERASHGLRRLIRRIEAVDMSLEEVFSQLDVDHSGSISATDLQKALGLLGHSYSEEDCAALIEYWSRSSIGSSVTHGTNSNGEHEGPTMSLLGFFRAMGRSSPPPPSNSNDEGGGNADEDVDESSNDPSPSRRMDLAQSSVVHAHQAADRLREIVLRAEREEGRRLEQSFRILDPDGNGYVDAADFRRGLRRLGRGDIDVDTSDADADANAAAGGAFATIDDEDCEELVALFDTNGDGLVSLLDFYRFLGRHSPPPMESSPPPDTGASQSSGSS